MSIEYTYTVIKVDESARCMEVVYTAAGHQTLHIGARLPFEGELLEDVIRQYEPTQYWREQQRSVTVPLEGTTNTLPPGIPFIPKTAVEVPVFSTIFPTPATGAIDITTFE